MSKFKILSSVLFVSSVALGSMAYAQDTETDLFTAADANSDNVLNLEEFGTYVAARADSGDAGYAAVRDSGDIKATFGALDQNADGFLDKTELGG